MTRLPRHLLTALWPLCAVGCIAPVGSPYGPPSGFVPAGGVQPYGQPYSPNGLPPGAVVVPQNGTVLPPAGSGSFGGAPTFAPPPGGSSAPSFRPPASGGFDRPPADPVPDYSDPNSGGFGGGGFDDDGFGTPGGSGSVPPARDDFGAPPAGGDFGVSPGGDDFGFNPGDDFGATSPRPGTTRPAPLAARLPTDGVRVANYDEPAGPQPAPTVQPGDPLFAHAGDYRVIRGKIDFDPQLNNWSVIYDVSPDLADEYGGSFTLHDPDGTLSRFRSEDIVALEGFPDRASGVDVLGKPLYRVKRAEWIGVAE